MEESSSSFPWELLPRSIQEEILSKLPISVIVRLRSISRSFLASIRSLPPSLSFPRDPFFFLFSSDELLTSSSSVLAYQPSLDRWITFPLPSTPSAASGSLLLLSDSVFNPFTGAIISTPPSLLMQSSIYPIPLLIDSGGNRPDFRIIVVVRTSDRVRSQVYDSASDSWTCPGDLPGHVHMVGNIVLFDGLLYARSYMPNRLLRFDLFSGDWEHVGGVLPSVACSHLVAFDGRLFLVGGVELFGITVSIQVWEFSKDGGNWELACSMPVEIFRVFNESERMVFFNVCYGKGILCFYNHLEDSLLMLDLVDWRWWWPSRCPLPENLGFWIGLAVEPNADILR